MTTLAVVALQVTSVLVIGLVTAGRLRHRAAALRHLVLFVTLAAAAVVPLVGRILPTWFEVPALRKQASVATVDVRTQLASGAAAPSAPLHDTSPLPARDLTSWLVVAWVAGAVAGLLRLLQQLWALSALRRRSVVALDHHWAALLTDARARLGLTRAVCLRVARDDEPVSSWGW